MPTEHLEFVSLLITEMQLQIFALHLIDEAQSVDSRTNIELGHLSLPTSLLELSTAAVFWRFPDWFLISIIIRFQSFECSFLRGISG